MAAVQAEKRAFTDADYQRFWQSVASGDLASVRLLLDEMSVDVNKGDPKNVRQCAHK